MAQNSKVGVSSLSELCLCSWLLKRGYNIRWPIFVFPFLDVFESSGQDQPMREELTLHLEILSLEASFPANLSICNILISSWNSAMTARFCMCSKPSWLLVSHNFCFTIHVDTMWGYRTVLLHTLKFIFHWKTLV